MSIVKYFPFPVLRPNQKEVLDAIERSWDSYNYTFLEAPTGSGKSAIGYAVAKWVLDTKGGFTHFLASDIYLQNQYLRDFKDIKLIKGRGNYNCQVSKLNVRHLYDDDDLIPEYSSCAKGPCTLARKYPCAYKPKYPKEVTEKRDKFGTVFLWNETEEPYCPYWIAKDEAIHSPLTIHNYHYFMNEMQYSKGFNVRDFGVFDEAHTIESMLMSFISMDIHKATLDRISRGINIRIFDIPDLDSLDDWMDWLNRINSTIHDQLEMMGQSEPIVEEDGTEPSEKNVIVLAQNFLEKLEELISNIYNEPDNWVWNITESKQGKIESVIFKPIKVAQYGKDLLFKHTNKHLFISATILDPDKLKSYLGITEDVKFLRVHNSNFPVQNRPLFIRSQGKATSATMIDYLPKMLDYMDNVLIPKLMKDKGVIHSHTNDIARYILTNSKHKNIMVSNVDNINNRRNDVFNTFFDSSPPRIMVTPSMRLGVDLRDDLARWQIITKVPYPYLGDPQIKRRTDLDSGWYEYQTITSLIQTYGRVCRSETDHGETYILDGKFDDVFFKNMTYFPMWVKEAIRR